MEQATQAGQAEAAPEAQAVVRAEDLGESLEPETGLLEGRAAVFDDELIGFPMAGGGQYDPDDLVAAHRNLPLGSLVEVRSVATGRSVQLTVADRGPYEKDVVLNVSRRAAVELGIADGGEVKLKLVGGHAAAPAPTSAGAAPTGTIKAGTATAQTPPAQTPPAAQVSEAVAGKVFWVQVGAFGDQGNAEAAFDVLRQRGYAGSRVIAPSAGSGVSRVQAGPFALREDASRALETLRADYPAAFVVTPD
ncbi:MAG: SPOR domain-containing protein [Desulfovibrionaceae bacterium]